MNEFCDYIIDKISYKITNTNRISYDNIIAILKAKMVDKLDVNINFEVNNFNLKLKELISKLNSKLQDLKIVDKSIKGSFEGVFYKALLFWSDLFLDTKDEIINNINTIIEQFCFKHIHQTELLLESSITFNNTQINFALIGHTLLDNIHDDSAYSEYNCYNVIFISNL